MDLRRLSYFAQIAELGSISRAAGRIRINQPALSRQILLLEQELGIKLFSRHRRGMKLTREGEELHARISDPLRKIELALRDARSLGNDTRANLVFGVPATIGYVLAGPLARRVASLAPHISLRIVEGYAGMLASSIARGEIDLALLYGPSSEWAFMDWAPLLEGVLIEDMLIEDMVLVGRSDCPLDPEKPVDVETLAGLPLVLPSQQAQPYGIRQMVNKVAEKSGVKLSRHLEADTFQLTKDFVESGLGYAVLPYSSISREVENGRLKYAPITNPKVTRHIVLGTRPGCQYPRAIALLKTILRQEVIDLVASGTWPATLLFQPEAAS